MGNLIKHKRYFFTYLKNLLVVANIFEYAGNSV